RSGCRRGTHAYECNPPGAYFFWASSFSRKRAPVRMPVMPMFPSWHAYSYIISSILVRGSTAVHGLVSVVGSETVNSYLIVSRPTRVKRSTSFVVALEPGALVSRLKLTVSTTSVSPSQRPRESPIHRESAPCG